MGGLGPARPVTEQPHSLGEGGGPWSSGGQNSPEDSTRRLKAAEGAPQTIKVS